MEAEKSGLPPWIVLDVRLAREGAHSGIARFITGFSLSLAEELRQRKREGRVPPNLRLLFASKYEPATWTVDLVRHYPEETSFWSGGKGALTSRWDKPVYWWPTGAIKRLKQYTHGDFLWVAPGNFDRPIFVGRLFGKKYFGRVVQIIHDAIPFEQPKSTGFFFGTQFRMRVKNTLNRFPLVLTVSEHSAQILRNLSKSKTVDIRVLGEGVDSTFGAKQRPVDVSERRFLRREFLTAAAFSGTPESEQWITNCRWILGVGRGQAYKCWDLAEKATAAARRDGRNESTLLVRIDGDATTARQFDERGAIRLGACRFLKEQGVLLIPSISDEALALLYRVSDMLVHPSLAEGFGLPPLEAALSGLPVLFRKGTAVDGHFPEGRLPEIYWRGMENSNEGEWALAVSEMLASNVKREKFFEAMAKAQSPRQFVLQSAGLEGAFEWRSAACAFLDALGAHHEFSEFNKDSLIASAASVGGEQG